MKKIEDKIIMIFGYGVTGQDVASVFQQKTLNYFIVDDNLTPKTKEELTKDGIKYYSTNEAIAQKVDYDLIVKSPGIKYEHELIKDVNPEIIINDIEIVYHLTEQTDTKIVAITGTNGKTSTTSFITTLLRSVGYEAFSCGNIGISPLKVIAENPKVDFLVMELSSFQLKAINKFRADYAFFLNFAPDHLDFHPDITDYYQSKLKIIKNCPNSQKIYAGEVLEDVTIPVCLPKNNIPERLETNLKGLSKVNMNLIYQFAKELEISDEQFINALDNEYNGLEHRCEYIGTKSGVKFYNDSKATNVESTRIALEQLDNIILLVGGSDKGEDLTRLNNYSQNVKLTIAYGANKEKFTLEPKVETDNLENAFNIAVEHASTDDVILLSPACASFDQYKNYEERGRHFKK